MGTDGAEVVTRDKRRSWDYMQYHDKAEMTSMRLIVLVANFDHTAVPVFHIRSVSSKRSLISVVLCLSTVPKLKTPGLIQ